MTANSKRNLTIVGFGNQAKAWAANLQDSGCQVSIALRDGSSSKALAEKSGFDVITMEQMIDEVVIVLAPDESHADVISKLHKKHTLLFAHGYSLYFTNLVKDYPEHSYLLLAPKAIASEVRREYLEKGQLAAVYSLEFSKRPEDEALIKEIAHLVGFNNIFKSDIRSEAMADLFSEQSLLCGLLPYASLASFNKLVEQGVEPKVAFLECWHEVRLIAHALINNGPVEFFKLISPNALLGAEKGRIALFGDEYQNALDQLYSDISDQSFLSETKAANFDQLREKTIKFWESEKLNEVFNELSPKLYGAKS